MMLDKPIQITEQNWSSGTVPVLSVFNWVYNHKDFIRESIESILIQKTTFPVEIIIHDDASNDGTKEIILEYQEKHPAIFRNILHEENQWSQGKSVMTPLFEKPKGKYIALTHGDDYWTDPYKLQKQVDFLDKNPDYSICFHNVQLLKGADFFKDNLTKEVPQSTTIQDLTNGNYIHTPSVVFRNQKEIIEMSTWLNEVKAGDYSLHLLNAQFGKIYKLDDIMAVYRIHDSNTWANLSSTSMHLNIFNDLFILSDKFEESINSKLMERFEKMGHSLIYEFLKDDKEEQALEIYMKLISKSPKKHIEIFLESLSVKTGRYHLRQALNLLRSRI
jgi:glycosyltransferase involved in cell wall biosynthesis